MLVAQADRVGSIVVSRDAAFMAYGVDVLSASWSSRDVVMKRRAVRRFEEGGVEPRGHRADRAARPAHAVGRVQPGPAAGRRDRPGPAPRGRADLRRGRVRSATSGRGSASAPPSSSPASARRSTTAATRSPTRSTRTARRSSGRSRSGGSTSARRCRHHAGGGRRRPRLRVRRPGHRRRCAPTSASPRSSPRSGSCRSAGRSRTSGHPASSAAGCRSRSSRAGMGWD